MTMSSGYPRVLQYPGSKWTYANWICSNIPEHTHYVEPFFGSGAVFFEKQPSPQETINDKDDNVVNLFQVCRDHPEELARRIMYTPYARTEFESVLESAAGESLPLTECSVENARRFLVRCNQGFGSSTADRVGWKNSKMPNGPRNATTWDDLPHRIRKISQRLKKAQIENVDGMELLEACSHPDCFAYVDPPYLFEQRKGRMYRHEMGESDQHLLLLDVLKTFQGKVMLSGYENDLYNEQLWNWNKSYKSGKAQHGGKRVEVLWTNYNQQMRLF